MPDAPKALRHPLPVRLLPARKPTRFDLTPDDATRRHLAAETGLIALPFLRFRGEVRPQGRRDLLLTATLEAVVVQPCSVTLAPVTSRLSAAVERRYLADYAEPAGDEVELDGDDTEEPMPEVIDAGLVATEELILALPLYPRATGAHLGEAAFAPPGAAPLEETARRPFAGLAALQATPAPKDTDDDGGQAQG
ncbi:MAG: YceD family protein [Gemmobacter sp.]